MCLSSQKAIALVFGCVDSTYEVGDTQNGEPVEYQFAVKKVYEDQFNYFP